jgi:hypothetical protein
MNERNAEYADSEPPARFADVFFGQQRYKEEEDEEDDDDEEEDDEDDDYADDDGYSERAIVTVQRVTDDA